MKPCLASFIKVRRHLVKIWLPYLKELISIYSLCFSLTSHRQCKQTSPTPTLHSSYLLPCPCTSPVSEWVFSLQLPCIIKAAVEVYCSGAELQRHYRPLQRSCQQVLNTRSLFHTCIPSVAAQWASSMLRYWAQFRLLLFNAENAAHWIQQRFWLYT